MPSSSYPYFTVLKLSHDQNLLALGDSSGNIHLFNAEDHKPLLSIPAHDEAVTCLDFSPENSKDNKKYLLASGSRDCLAHMYYLKGDSRGGISYENMGVF